MTPTLGQEAQTFFQEREHYTHKVYTARLKTLAIDPYIKEPAMWHEARDLRHDWQLAYADWKRAMAATPCDHRVAERAHESQRCSWCWLISTYSRLSTQEIEDDDR